MNILFLSAEVGPFVSVGGLSQVMYFLPRALAKQGHDVRVFTPKYGAMDKTAPRKRAWKLATELTGMKVPISNTQEFDQSQHLVCNVKSYKHKIDKVKTYFLENREYYELRANVFGYKDDHVRFALLCKGCLEWLLALKSSRQKKKEQWWPDVIHCNDWHAAYFIELARRNPRYRDLLEKTPIVLTVHNFKYQGNYEFQYCLPEDCDDGQAAIADLLSDKLLKQNALLRGLIYADAVTTVSPTHAREVMTPEYAEGLEDTLQRIRGKVSGILNGLDTKEFDPANDPFVFKPFTVRSFELARKRNKKHLQQEFMLPTNPDAFVLAFLGRLVPQKGIALILQLAKHALQEFPHMQLIVLGGGDDTYRQAFLGLKEVFPNQIGLHLLPNFRLPRKIFSGADAVLMPSFFEPGGIVALEALRYGGVPIVRRTGGLNDIVEDFDPEQRKGNGFSFTGKDPWALFAAIVEAATTFKHKKLWTKLVENCMRSDFSWEHSAKEYEQWYRRALEERKRVVRKAPHAAYAEP